MARRQWPDDGVGRGNGVGSARTQFRSGMPSANPAGRPRKPKVAPNASFKEAALSQLAAVITTTEDGVARKRSRGEAMIMLLMADFQAAGPREKIAMLRYLGKLAPEVELMRNRDLPKDAINEFVSELAQEATRLGLDWGG